MGTVVFLLILTFILFRKYGFFAAALFGYCSIGATFVSLCPLFPWYPLQLTTWIFFQELSTQSLLFIIIVVLSIMFTPKESIFKWLDGFVIVALISSLIISYKYLNHENLIYGILSNSGEDATFIGLVQPYMWTKKRFRPLLVVTLTAILMARSSTGFGLVVLQLTFLGSLLFKPIFDKIVYLIISIVVWPFTGKVLLGDKLLNNDGRFHVWALTWDFFKSTTNPWTGLGAASFRVFMPEFQLKNGIPDMFLWAHNDLLQTLFEYGIIGVSLMMGLYFLMLYRSKGRPWVFVTLLSMLIGAFLQMPFRLMLLALFYALMCRISLRPKELDSIYG